MFDDDIDYELGSQLGDPRRCERHPEVKTSSPDGMHDAPCWKCEQLMEDAAVHELENKDYHESDEQHADDVEEFDFDPPPKYDGF